MIAKNSAMRGCFVALLLLIPAHANAGGSISLEDVVSRLAGQSGKLMQEINTQLAASGKTIADIVCDGTRLGRHFKHLGGLRIPTFTCAFGRKQLTLDGAVAFYNARGKADDAPATAMYVSLSNPKWSWK